MELTECRKQIDLLDEELVKLFCRRLELAAEAGAAKAALGLPVTDPGREREKLESVSAMAGEEAQHYIRKLYSAIFRVCRAYERERLASAGENGT